MSGKSIARTRRSLVAHARNAAPMPLTGPRDGDGSRTSCTSAGRHGLSSRAERKIAAGRSARSFSSCTSHSGFSFHSIVALSRPIRSDSPPQSRTAEKFTGERAPVRSRAIRHHSESARANRRCPAGSPARRARTPDSSNSRAAIPPCRETARLARQTQCQ